MAKMTALTLLNVALGAMTGNPPLVLVPGLTGSALEVKESKATLPHIWCKTDTHDDWMKVWVEPSQALPKEIDCLAARLTLTYDAASDSYSNLPGVELRALGFGNGTAAGKSKRDILYQYEFGHMIDHVSAALGYEVGRDLFIAPYDWRLAGDAHAQASNGVGGFYSQLKELLENSVSASGRKAVVLSHSLGCPTMLYFFHKFVSAAWKDEHIEAWVAVSGPWMGGATQVSAYLGGWTLGLPSWLVPHDYVKKVQVNASSGVWLTPHPNAFGERIVASTPSRNYTADDIPELISRIGLQAGGEQTVSLFDKLRKPFLEIQSPPEQVKMYNWYSYGVPTAERYIYGSEIHEGFNEAPQKTIFGEGDGIVNLVSLQQVEQAWPSGSNEVQTEVFPNCSHFGMLSDARVLSALTQLLGKTESELIV